MSWPSRLRSCQERGSPAIGRAPSLGGSPLHAHGGYLIRLESFVGLELLQLARQALALDGVTGVLPGLQVSVIRRRKVARLAFVGPSTAGPQGVHWYAEHHALPRLLSLAANATVHAYIYDPEQCEQVIAYGNGHRVGGDRVVYDSVELSGEEEMDDAAFTRMRARWPMGHLAYVFGITREELLGIPRVVSGVMLALDAEDADERLERLLPTPQLFRVTTDAA